MGYDPSQATDRRSGKLHNRSLVVSPHLVAMFHQEDPPNQDQMIALEKALLIARRAVAASLQVISHMQTGHLVKGPSAERCWVEDSDGYLDDEFHDAFWHHMGFDYLKDHKDWGEWIPDLQRVRNNLAAIQNHLSTQVKIGNSDDYVRSITDKDIMDARWKDPAAAQRLLRARRDGLEGMVKLKRAIETQILGDSKNAIPGNKLWEEQLEAGKLALPPEYWGNIKVGFRDLLTVPKLQKAGAIIHESSHKMISTGDICYAKDWSAYKNLTKDQKMRNADGYAFLAISLYKRTCFENDAHLRQLKEDKKAIDTSV